ncbi:cell wall hydrolase [Gellertiella hungarica]|uniref:Spore germination cell wall hydrolase CwlJ-like protein n=1 Tax=Gellertiella hungarica TaxID=1572859 RepID=A0A7W6NKF4_9HYPH|nr:cell wall hydrolase [Gellertiella hungarica]MBB4064345.1 spore germination cell wall hydrolase CwlJ-like protein [Gellertiella hungarica]
MSQKGRFALPIRGSWISPFVFGIAAWLGTPSLPAHGDMAGLLTGLDDGTPAWRMVVTAVKADSVAGPKLTFHDPVTAEMLGRKSGMVLPDGNRVAMTEDKYPPDPRPDEERINRKDKRGRIVAAETMQPPKAFTAGSVLQRVSAVFANPETPDELMAFAKAEPKGTEMMIAQTFYRKPDEKALDAQVPALIADLVTNRNADVLATAYAPADPDAGRTSPFDAILKKDPEEGRFRPVIGPKDHAWAANILPPSVFTAKEQKCLADAIYFEARGEPLKGQAAVAQVVLNRVRNPAYPDTICGVVYQNKDWTNQCQFSFACDRIKDIIWSPERHKVAEEIALAVTAGKIWLPEVGSSTHYHAIYVKPNWAPTMKRVAKIGWHIFYRTYGGGWS